ncbi:hypothetical protein [Mycoplasma todarodis]|uniref:hypothetical protein n=1 Tax=Mycoplasma todarodis TaxID=1937191 RepID=UPI003B366FA7
MIKRYNLKLKILSVFAFVAPIAFVASCGESNTKTDKQHKDIDKQHKDVYVTKDEQILKVGDTKILNSKGTDLSDELKTKVKLFNNKIKDILKIYKNRGGEVIQPLVYDFSNKNLNCLPIQVLKVFKRGYGIFKMPITLKLSHNNFKGFDFTRLPFSVEKVHLDHNKITSVNFWSVSRNIKELDLSFNEFTGKVPTEDMHHLRNGTIVDLRNNKFTQINSKHLNSLKYTSRRIALVKDNASAFNSAFPEDALFKKDSKPFNETKAVLTFPNLFFKEEESTLLDNLIIVILITKLNYTRILLANNNINW